MEDSKVRREMVKKKKDCGVQARTQHRDAKFSVARVCHGRRFGRYTGAQQQQQRRQPARSAAARAVIHYSRTQPPASTAGQQCSAPLREKNRSSRSSALGRRRSLAARRHASAGPRQMNGRIISRRAAPGQRGVVRHDTEVGGGGSRPDLRCAAVSSFACVNVARRFVIRGERDAARLLMRRLRRALV